MIPELPWYIAVPGLILGVIGGHALIYYITRIK